MITLLPRLPAPAADRLLDEMLSGGELQWVGFAPESLPDLVRYGATGGSTITSHRLRELRDGLAEVASGFGFPASGNREGHARFDAALASWLRGVEELETGEGLRDDVWAFIGVVLAPDVVHWRFGEARERYLGGVRNTFQRVWMRAAVLDRGVAHPERWGLLEQLTEDALVQITERPSIGADPVLARELGEAWVRASARLGRGKMEGVMRLATLRVRIRNEIQALSLAGDELPALLDEFFDAAASTGTQLGRDDGQPADSVASSEAADVISAEDPSSTRKRSWAIWRAR